MDRVTSPPPPARQLAARALETTAENPWPVRLLSAKIADYIAKMAPVWIEGQVVQLNRRPGANIAFLTLRDTDQDVSLPVAIQPQILAQSGQNISSGDHVIVHATATFWRNRGTLQMQADAIRAVGIGELLARIEHLKRVLAAEGLFAAERKQPLPFLPAVIGLICGRESKAEHDVVVNAQARWPGVRFEIREVAVQGAAAVPEVCAALAELDARPDVEVIVIARGGGAVEDLLPFSNETLVRAAAAARTPIVSAIGHETDQPLLDLVADLRASTPTDAAKRIVPDISAERLNLRSAQDRARRALRDRLAREHHLVSGLASRPVLAQPGALLAPHARDLTHATAALRNSWNRRLLEERSALSAVCSQLRTLSPAATLERGYAIAQLPSGEVVRNSEQLPPGTQFRLRLANGEIQAETSSGKNPKPRRAGEQKQID